VLKPRIPACLLSITMTLMAAAPVVAQTYPAKSVRVIVPYPPGGGNDIIARAVVDELSRRTAQQFYVDNRPGASTIIGAELAIKAPPDGYTLFVSSQTTLAIVPNLKTKVPYDPLRDFEPVSLLATQPYLVVTHPSLPVHNVAQLAALAKSRPGKIVYASSGIGTGGHLSGELFKMMTRTDMLHVPYKGGAQAVNDLVGGHVSVIRHTVGQAEKLGGIGWQVAAQLEELTGKESRTVVLGHLLRGGSPTAFDRLLGLRFGAAAVRGLQAGEDGVMVALNPPRVDYVPLSEATSRMKSVPLDCDTMLTARDIGINFGDHMP